MFHAKPAAWGTPPPTMALVPIAPASRHCRCIEPPRPRQNPSASPQISASVRCSTSCTSGVIVGSLPGCGFDDVAERLGQELVVARGASR